LEVKTELVMSIFEFLAAIAPPMQAEFSMKKQASIFAEPASCEMAAPEEVPMLLVRLFWKTQRYVSILPDSLNIAPPERWA